MRRESISFAPDRAAGSRNCNRLRTFTTLVLVLALFGGCAAQGRDELVEDTFLEVGLEYDAPGGSLSTFSFAPVEVVRVISVTESLDMRDFLKISDAYVRLLWRAPKANWSIASINIGRACDASSGRFDRFGITYEMLDPEGGRGGIKYSLGLSIDLRQRKVGGRLEGRRPAGIAARYYGLGDLALSADDAIRRADAAGGEQYKFEVGRLCREYALFDAHVGRSGAAEWTVTYATSTSAYNMWIDPATGEAKFTSRFPR